MKFRYRLIPSKWLKDRYTSADLSAPSIKEGYFTQEELDMYNREGYNIYYFPNGPIQDPGVRFISYKNIDRFSFIFIDIDLKDMVYSTKQEAIDKLKSYTRIPTFIVDSGNGVHAYWRVSDLTKEAYVTLQLKLIQEFKSDPSVYTILQLMRLPKTYNVKVENDKKYVDTVLKSEATYTVNDFNYLPPLNETQKGQLEAQLNPDKCKNFLTEVSDSLPQKFQWLINRDQYIKDLFYIKAGDDRSSTLWKLTHELIKRRYTRQEILDVASKTPKVQDKGLKWYQEHVLKTALTHNIDGSKRKFGFKSLAEVVNSDSFLTDKPRLSLNFDKLDPFIYGFRQGDVEGLIGGSGSGKSTYCLNKIRLMAANNPDFIHVYVNLEMSSEEAGMKFQKQLSSMENGDKLQNKLYLIDNQAEDGSFKNLSLEDIKNEIITLESITGEKVGCVVIDNINILDKGLKDSRSRETYENQTLMKVCKDMKAFARMLDIYLIMQSQTSREKAGELCNVPLYQDAAYGTSKFEAYCSYVTTIWQPLREVYPNIQVDWELSDYQQDCRLLALRYCKVRFQDKNDKIKPNDVVLLRYNIENDTLTDLNVDDQEVYNKYHPLAMELLKKKKREKETNIVHFEDIKNTKSTTSLPDLYKQGE